MNPRPATLLLLATIITLLPTSTINSLIKPTNIDARNVVLYNSSIALPDQQFNITFSQPFKNLPLLVYAINDYKLGDQFYVQNFDSQQTSLLTTKFSINVTLVSSTSPTLFSISYFAAQQQSSFLSDYQTHTNPTNISTGTLYRYYSAYITKNFTSLNVFTLPLITSFYITSSTYFQINTTASVISTVNYKFTVETSSDCKILRISFYLLFCQETDMQNQNYSYNGGMYSVIGYNAGSNPYFLTTVNNYEETVFILGLRGLSGFTILSGCYWGWSVQSVSSDTATLKVDQNQLQNIQYSFFQIGKAVPSSTTTTTQTNYLPIIIGIVVGVIILTIGVIIFLKLYWKRSILNMPSKDDFREMPSITF